MSYHTPIDFQVEIELTADIDIGTSHFSLIKYKDGPNWYDWYLWNQYPVPRDPPDYTLYMDSYSEFHAWRDY